MRDKGKFRKWAWLLLIAAFAVIAGGGCNGSSGGGGDVVNVTEIDASDHPLAEHLRKLYHQMPEGTIFLSEKFRSVSFPEMKAKLKAAFEEGKIIGMYGPTRARIEELHDALGIDIFKKQTAAGDEPEVEFYMIKRHDGLIFQNRQHYVGKGTPGAVFYQRGPLAISGDQEISDYAVEEPVEPVGDKREAYPRIAEAIASWNGLVAEHAVKVRADAPSVRDALRAAEDPNPNQLGDLAPATTYTDHFHFPDQEKDVDSWFGRFRLHDGDKADNPDCWYKFPTIYTTATMYSCYSYGEDANYYMIITNASMNNEKNYHHWRYFFFDWEQNATRRYFSKPEMLHVSDPKDEKKLLLKPDHQPQNKNDGYSESDGFSLNVTGSVGFTGSAGTTNSGASGNLGLSAGIGISHTQSYTIQDYRAIDHTKDGVMPWTEWLFSLPAQDNGGYEKNLHEASDASRTNFTSEESWVWKVARSEADAYSFVHNFEYCLVLVRGGASILNIPAPIWDDELSWEARSHAGCTIDLPIPPTLAVSVPSLSVNKEGRLTSGGETVKFDLFSDGDWTLESDADADWVTISHTKGSGGKQSQEITLSILPNPNPEFRHAWITATGTKDPNGKIQKTSFEITQEPDNTKQWTIFVDPASMASDGVSPDCMGGQYKFSVRSDTDWIASCSASWVHLDKTSGGPTGSSPVEITFTVDENTTIEDRYADVIVRDATVPNGQYRAIRISQPAPMLEVDRTALEYGYYSGPQTFNVLATADWTVSTDAGWIHPDKTKGSAAGGDPQAVKVSVAQNIGPARSGKIVVSDAAGQTKTVNVSQAAPVLEVDPTALKFSYYPGPQYLNVLSGADWTASCDADWVVLSPTQGGQSVNTPQKIKVSLYMNGGAPRSADIVVRDAAGQTRTVHVQQDQVFDIDPTSIVSSKNGGRYQLKLRSDIDWTLKYDAHMVHIAPERGGQTNKEWKLIQVEILPTDTSRSTQITLHGEGMNYHLNVDVKQQ